ncbi:MAG TPA: hypothetical protein VFS92_08040 [Planctomycetota bacterium]|nr:hypothetical protein [Planctomycetota bacterium]
MFPRPEIEERLSKFARVRLWINDSKPEAQSARWAAMLRSRFKTSAIPYYAVLSPADEVIGTIDFPGGSLDSFAARLGSFLDDALAKSGAK